MGETMAIPRVPTDSVNPIATLPGKSAHSAANLAFLPCTTADPRGNSMRSAEHELKGAVDPVASSVPSAPSVPTELYTNSLPYGADEELKYIPPAGASA